MFSKLCFKKIKAAYRTDNVDRYYNTLCNTLIY